MKADDEGRFTLEIWDETTNRFLGRVQLEGLQPESSLRAEVVQGEDGTWR